MLAPNRRIGKTRALGYFLDALERVENNRNKEILTILNDIFDEKGISKIIESYGIDDPDVSAALKELQISHPSLVTIHNGV